MISLTENSHLYNMHEWQRGAMAPFAMFAKMTTMFFRNPLMPMTYTDMGKRTAAAGELVERITRRYHKQPFGITSVKVDGKEVAVHEIAVDWKPFSTLLHFKKDLKKDQPKMLIVAPMSGHHATLLRGTVQDLLPYLDVYITDWHDAREVPSIAGKFDLNDYVDYVMDFTRTLSKNGEKVHLLAVCQPAVPVFAAACIMNAAKDKKSPASITLIGGPIDTREAPTKVNLFAKQHPLSWFEQHMITRVPYHYPGFMRRVYPGFMQLHSFISMNLERHVDAHKKFYDHLVEGDGEGATAHKKFYDEYLSVSDITAEFYLQSLDVVFQRHSLPKGEFKHHGKLVKPEALTKTALLCLEGELDDISGLGQTKAAIKIAKNLPANMKKYHMEPKVGHYGIFNGRKFRERVVPIIADWAKKHD